MTVEHIALIAGAPFIAILYVKLLVWLDERAGDNFDLSNPEADFSDFL